MSKHVEYAACSEAGCNGYDIYSIVIRRQGWWAEYAPIRLAPAAIARMVTYLNQRQIDPKEFESAFYAGALGARFDPMGARECCAG